MREQELVVALSGFVCQFETQFASLAYQLTEAEKEREYHTVTGTVGVWNSPNGFCTLSLFVSLYAVQILIRRVSVWIVNDDKLS